MVLSEFRCPSCGAPADRTERCRYCGALLALPTDAGWAVTIERIDGPRLAAIKCVRELCALGLAEAKDALEHLPATFTVHAPNATPASVLSTLAAVGCAGKVVRDVTYSPSDPTFANHQGTWGIQIEKASAVTTELVTLLREVTDLGAAEAKAALAAPRTLIPISTRMSHDEIRRRFARLGFAVSFAPSGG